MSFLGLYPWHMEVPRLGLELELHLPVYAIAIVPWDPSHICNLCHSSQQHWTLNPLSEARDQTCMDNSQVCYCWAMTGTPISSNSKSWNICLTSRLWFTNWKWHPLKEYQNASSLSLYNSIKCWFWYYILKIVLIFSYVSFQKELWKDFDEKLLH